MTKKNKRKKQFEIEDTEPCPNKIEDVDMNEQFEKAITIASQAHMGQRRWEGRPLIIHSMNVGNSFLPHDNSTPTKEQLLLASVGFLHDYIEDTKFNKEDLESSGVCNEIIEIVGLLTKDDYPKNATEDEKDEIYKKYIEKIKTNKNAIKVKLVDLHDNLNLLGPPKGKRLNIFRLEKYRRAYFELKEALLKFDSRVLDLCKKRYYELKSVSKELEDVGSGNQIGYTKIYLGAVLKAINNLDIEYSIKALNNTSDSICDLKMIQLEDRLS